MATKIKTSKGTFYRMDAYFPEVSTTRLIERAAKLDGRKVSQFIAKAAEDAARAVMERERTA